MPVVVRAQRAQRALIGAPRRGVVAECVVRAAEREGREGEFRLGEQGSAEGGDRALRLSCLQQDHSVRELPVGVERVAEDQRRQLGQRLAAIAPARLGQCGGQSLTARAWLTAKRTAGAASGWLRRTVRASGAVAWHGDPHCPLERVRGSEQHPAAGPQRPVQPLDDALGDRRLEVDEDVAAEDEIEVRLPRRRHRVPYQVVAAEPDHLAEPVPHQVAAIRRGSEVPGAQGIIERPYRARPVPAGQGGREGSGRDVRAEDVHRRRSGPERLGREQRERVRLFARRAAGAPDADHPRSRGARAGEQRVPANAVQLPPVADERGLLDRNLVDEAV